VASGWLTSMSCAIQMVDASKPAPEAIARAAEAVRAGGLVAFPTETVYGLGANALNAAAVARIFDAKGRPATNPIIVHVASVNEAKQLVTAWPESAQRLADRFWPGPLTLVLRKAPHVPDLVTANGPTVALRIPAHPVALALLKACNFPLAAPSANRSAELSPTLPEHVLRSLGDRIDLLLDAGPTSGGLESTVLDMTTDPPLLLRPGLVTITELEALLGPIQRDTHPDQGIARSPGQMPRHYAPRTKLDLTRDSAPHVSALAAQGLRVGWLTHLDVETPVTVLRILLPADTVSYAAQLYAALHQLDDAGLDRIVVETPPGGDDWLAVHDRLRRATN
jgi:L-threonylcarbamoyladenylate synthase